MLADMKAQLGQNSQRHYQPQLDKNIAMGESDQVSQE